MAQCKHNVSIPLIHTSLVVSYTANDSQVEDSKVTNVKKALTTNVSFSTITYYTRAPMHDDDHNCVVSGPFPRAMCQSEQ